MKRHPQAAASAFKGRYYIVCNATNIAIQSLDNLMDAKIVCKAINDNVIYSNKRNDRKLFLHSVIIGEFND
ncbi:MAG: hypothetical protein ACRC3J_05130 [Culicoidibacterales bacterium]